MNEPHHGPAPPVLLTADAQASYAPTLPVLRRLTQAGFQAFLVGGGVRDLLLEREVADWDIATSATPEEVLELWPHAVPTGLRHGTLTLVLETGPLEVTTYRNEGPYGDGRRPDWVQFGATLQEDLARRDLTVNAMALDPVSGVLYDPEGGLRDLKAAELRAVGDPDERFREDALRPLRAIRLAAVLEFSLETATLAAVSRAAAGVIGVARERVRDELLKLLRAPRPSIGIELLRTTGILQHVLPELLEGVEMAQNRYHAYDVYHHTLHTVDAAPADNLRVRLAALLHDVGKPRTRAEKDGEGTFYRHEIVGKQLTLEMLDRLRLPRRERDAVAHLVGEHMFHYAPDWSDGAVRRFLARVGPENVADLFALRRADDAGAGTGKDPDRVLRSLETRLQSVIAQDQALSVRDLEVDGAAVMEALGMPPGPEVGNILNALLEAVLDDPGLNNREQLLARARELRGNA